jgi:hypothetical protein
MIVNIEDGYKPTSPDELELGEDPMLGLEREL